MIEEEIESLWNDDILKQVPHHEMNPENNFLEKFNEMTKESQQGSSIHSGYRYERISPLEVKRIQELAQRLQGESDSMIVCGIGGSALGASALYSALKFKCKKELIFFDNLDPIRCEMWKNTLNWERLSVCVISKSGGTLESIAAFQWLLDTAAEKKIDLSQKIAVITDAEKGSLLDYAKKSQITPFQVPSKTGGRFSVFSAVAYLPLAFAGVDILKLEETAQKSFQSAPSKKLIRLAHRLYELEKANYSVHHLNLYSSMLQDLGAWFVQLWGESLGKEKTNNFSTGSFPCYSIGSTDQHSILQFLMEGKTAYVGNFIAIKNWPDNSKISVEKFHPSFGSLNYAQKKNFSEIINAQYEATFEGLISKKKALYKTKLDRLDEASLAALLCHWMDLTTALGIFHGIDPYNQPGVEMGKVILQENLK